MRSGTRIPRPLRLAVVTAIAAVVLSACVRQGPPAPVDDKGVLFFGRGTAVPVARPAGERSRLSPGSMARAPLVTTPGRVTVQSGDTLYGISRRNNVPIRAIINANNLSPPYNVSVGRQLILPRQSYHRVQPGETVNTIARIYGVSTQELIRTNAIEPPYLIYVGEPILLPMSSPPTAPPTAPASSAVASAPLPSPGVSSAPGDRSLSAPSETGPVPPPSGMDAASRPAEITPPAPADAMIDAPASMASLPPPNMPVEPSVAAPPGAFIWPVQGTVLSTFGTKPGGLINDGINIAAPLGTPVRASQDGTVAYAGNELRGYGNLLLVRHENGWMTAYAHNRELLVGRGDRVRRGQVIARVGATGNVDKPQLHFEMRQGQRSVDPTRYLSGQGVSSRS